MQAIFNQNLANFKWQTSLNVVTGTSSLAFFFNFARKRKPLALIAQQSVLLFAHFTGSVYLQWRFFKFIKEESQTEFGMDEYDFGSYYGAYELSMWHLRQAYMQIEKYDRLEK
jgi:hypothetical protein